MTRDEFILLQSSDTKQIIESYLNLSSLTAALKIGNAAICSQIKYLARSSKKLPHYFDARCVVSEILYEQCSSEVAAFSKFDGLSGETAIDLTCGLGVDTFALSKTFKNVISVESDALKADIATYNFNLLGANNITIVNTTAEAFCIGNNVAADLIYVDPSRVAVGKRVFSIAESSPNIIEIMPALAAIAQKIIIKLSPMFDIDECFKIFGDNVTVEAVSVKNECKEVLVKIGFSEESTIVNTILKENIAKRFAFDRDKVDLQTTANFTPQYVHIPDVVLYKTRTITNYISGVYPDKVVKFDNYLFSEEPLPDFAGQSFKIEQYMPYQPKKIKKLGVKRSTVHIRNFPHTLGQALRDLSLTEGGDKHILLTTYDCKPTFFLTTAYNEEL